MELSSDDLRDVSEVLQGIYAHRDLDAYASEVVGLLRKVVPADQAVYAEVNLPRRRLVQVMDPPEAHLRELDPILAEHLHEHVLVNRYQETGDGRAHAISEFQTQEQFHQLALYNEFYRHYPVEDQVAVWLPSKGPLAITFALSRPTRSFKPRDLQVLNLLRPHLIQAYRNAEAVTLLKSSPAAEGRGTEVASNGVVLLTDEGRVESLNPQARALLPRFFSGFRRDPERLPKPLAEWVVKQISNFRAPHIPRPVRPFMIRAQTSRLTVRIVPRPLGGYVLAMEEVSATAPALADDDPRVRALAPRQQQVLKLLMRGSSEKEAATELNLSRHTVHEYVKEIYRELGVSSRAELMARMMRSVG